MGEFFMVRAELVNRLAQKQGISKKDADIATKTVFRDIVNELSNGGKVELRGFGSFTIRNRSPRKGRNPKTCKIVAVPSKKVHFFKTGQDLKIVS